MDMYEVCMNDCAVQLAKIIARKFKHDTIVLVSASSVEEWYDVAMFGDFSHFGTIVDTEPLELDGKPVKIKYLDCDGHLIKNPEDKREELVSKLYSSLKNGAVVSNGTQKLNAEDVPEFMLGCVLNGYA